MTSDSSARCAALAAALAFLLPVAAEAGTGVYDMSPLIDQPHPFAISAAQPAARSPAPTPGSTVSDIMSPPSGVRRGRDRVADIMSPQSDSRGAGGRTVADAMAGASPPVRKNEPTFLTLAAGYYDINDNEGAAEFRIEWKGRKWLWAVKPIVGIMGTSDAAVYGYGGIALDVFFGDRIVATPSFAVGAYEDGNGKDLGSVIEFRSSLELAWRFDNGSRAGVGFYHLSNAGIDDNNPGTEVLSFGYSIPLN